MLASSSRKISVINDKQREGMPSVVFYAELTKPLTSVSTCSTCSLASSILKAATQFLFVDASDSSTVGEIELLEGDYTVKSEDEKVSGMSAIKRAILELKLQDGTNLPVNLTNVLKQDEVVQPNKHSILFVKMDETNFVRTCELLAHHKLCVRRLTMEQLAPLKMKRKINKKILLGKMEMLLDPELQVLLERCTLLSTKADTGGGAREELSSLLLPQLFNGLQFERVHKIIHGNFDCNVKADQPPLPGLPGDEDHKKRRPQWATLPKRIAVTYRDALDYWTNCLFLKIPFMSENRGTVYEVIPLDEEGKDEGRKGERDLNSRVTFRPLCLPLTKFWNYDHRLATSSADTPDTPESGKSAGKDGVVTMEKYDGYIIKLYWYDDRWCIATNSEVELSSGTGGSGGTDGQEDVILRNSKRSAREIFLECAAEEKLDYARLKKTHCYVFEMMHPECRIVVPCPLSAPRGMLIHLATRDMCTLRELLLDDKEHDIGIRHPRLYPELDNFEKRKRYVDELHWSKGEGLIEFYPATGQRKKIKGSSYMREHKLLEVHGEEKVKYLREYLVEKWLEDEGKLVHLHHPELKESFDDLTRVVDMLATSVMATKSTGKTKTEVKEEKKSKATQAAIAYLQKQTFAVTTPITGDLIKEILRKKRLGNYINKKLLVDLSW